MRSDLYQGPVVEATNLLDENIAPCYTQDDNTLCQSGIHAPVWPCYSNKFELQQDVFGAEFDALIDWPSEDDILEPGFDNTRSIFYGRFQNPLAAIQTPSQPDFVSLSSSTFTIPDTDPNYEWLRIPRGLIEASSSSSTPQSNQPLTDTTTPTMFASIDTPSLIISHSTPQSSPASGTDNDGRLELPPQALSSLHVCPTCSASFALSRTLVSHIRAHHSISVCPECKIEVRGQLGRHIRERHGDHRHRFVCICGKSFPRKSNFERHRGTHICTPGKRRQIKKRSRVVMVTTI